MKLEVLTNVEMPVGNAEVLEGESPLGGVKKFQ